jgi:triosephosphate isomerase (TIM)
MKYSTLLTMALAASTASAFSPASTASRGSTTALAGARKAFIAGNWKLNPQTKQDAIQLATDIANSITESSPPSDVALFVPYVFIEAAMNASNGKLQVGAEVSSNVLYMNSIFLYMMH